jgi:hypothetical protein
VSSELAWDRARDYQYILISEGRSENPLVNFDSLISMYLGVQRALMLPPSCQPHSSSQEAFGGMPSDQVFTLASVSKVSAR